MVSKIEWTDESWNPIVGCSKVSPGCQNCYALRNAASPRLQQFEQYKNVIEWDHDPKNEKKNTSRWNGKTVFVKSQIKKPLNWKNPRRVFVCSMGDLFHESAPFEWIDQVFAIMARCPQHTFQVLTKRPERMKEYFDGLANDPDQAFRLSTSGYSMQNHSVAMKYRKEGFLDNVWLGVTAENQEMADQRIPVLLKMPAAKHFISIEPMVGTVDLNLYLGCGSTQACHMDMDCNANCHQYEGINWVIVGCESLHGGKATIRGFADEDDWWKAAYSIYQQCQDAKVPFFFKQGPIDGKVVKPDKHPGKVPPWARTQEFPSK